jgi:hypothetical protein
MNPIKSTSYKDKRPIFSLFWTPMTAITRCFGVCPGLKGTIDRRSFPVINGLKQNNNMTNALIPGARIKQVYGIIHVAPADRVVMDIQSYPIDYRARKEMGIVEKVNSVASPCH